MKHEPRFAKFGKVCCLWKHVFNQQCKSQSFIRVGLHRAGNIARIYVTWKK